MTTQTICDEPAVYRETVITIERFDKSFVKINKGSTFIFSLISTLLAFLIIIVDEKNTSIVIFLCTTLNITCVILLTCNDNFEIKKYDLSVFKNAPKIVYILYILQIIIIIILDKIDLKTLKVVYVLISFINILIIFFNKDIFIKNFVDILTANSILSKIIKTSLYPILVVFCVIFNYKHIYLSFNFTVLERLFYFIFGSFIGNSILVKYLDSTDDEYIKFSLIFVLFITSTFGSHQSFNAMIFVITNPENPLFVCILINLTVQILSSIIQGFVGYFTNFTNNIIDSEKDEQILDNILEEFKDMTFFKSIKLGLNLNSLTDTIYSIAWGDLIHKSNHKNPLVTLLWSSVTKETIMFISTITSTISRIFYTESFKTTMKTKISNSTEWIFVEKTNQQILNEKNISDGFSIFTIFFILLITFYSFYALKKYYEDEVVSSSFLEKIKETNNCFFYFKKLIRIILFFTILTFSIYLNFAEINLTLVIIISVINFILTLDFIIKIM